MTIRPIKNISLSKPVLEGAGVKLNRAFGFGNSDISDPFLLNLLGIWSPVITINIVGLGDLGECLTFFVGCLHKFYPY